MKFHDNMTEQSEDIRQCQHKTALGKKAQEVVLKADRNLFSHMLLVAESRKVNMKDVFAHSLRPLPWALANADRSLRKQTRLHLLGNLKRTSPLQKTFQPHLPPSMMV